MTLLTVDSVSLAYGSPGLLEQVSFSIDRGERICLIGRNGTGKSTLLRIIDGAIQPDAGQLRAAPGLKIARLTQEIAREEAGSVSMWLPPAWVISVCWCVTISISHTPWVAIRAMRR